MEKIFLLPSQVWICHSHLQSIRHYQSACALPGNKEEQAWKSSSWNNRNVSDNFRICILDYHAKSEDRGVLISMDMQN